MPENKFVAALIEVTDTSDICGKQIGRSLHALKRCAQRTGQGFSHHRFSDTWHILYQDMSIAKQSDEEQVNHLALTDNHSFHVIS